MEKGKEEEVIREIADYEIFFSPLGLGGTGGKEEGVCCQGGGQVRSCGKWKVARAGEEGRRNERRLRYGSGTSHEGRYQKHDTVSRNNSTSQ